MARQVFRYWFPMVMFTANVPCIDHAHTDWVTWYSVFLLFYRLDIRPRDFVQKWPATHSKIKIIPIFWFGNFIFGLSDTDDGEEPCSLFIQCVRSVLLKLTRELYKTLNVGTFSEISEAQEAVIH